MRHYLRTAACLLLACIAASPALTDELPIRQPWLNERLPPDALIYARLPHHFGLFSMPKGSVLDPALASEANLENVRRIREGIVDNILPHVPAFADLRLRMLVQHLRSPVEIAAFFVPAPSTLVAVNLDLESDAAFEDMLAAIALEVPEFGLAAPLDGDGIGQLTGTPVPVHLQFDADTGRLLLNAGPGVTAESFAATAGRLADPADHRMQAMESRIDSGGQGLYLWIDAAQAVPAMSMFVQPEQMQTLEAMGLTNVSAAAFGWGVANGKGRLTLAADLPEDGDRGLLPYIENELGARTVGAPDGVMLLSIPGAEEIARLEARLLARADASERDEWESANATYREMTGMTITESLGAFGPDAAVVFDAAGDYFALRLREPRTFDRLIDALAAHAGSPVEERRIRGTTYHHLAVPSDLSGLDEQEAGELAWFVALGKRMRDHWYWIRDDDYLYFAASPQPLIDREAMRPRTVLGEWLAEEQRIDARNAVVSFSGTTRKLPRRAWTAYVELLQMLADVAQADFDIWSMPTPRQLELPEIGTIGLTVSLGDPGLSAELTFENNPAEFLGGVGGVAAVGVLAAIAIPAYQDYTVRAQISEGLTLAASVKAAVAEYHAVNGRFPAAAEAAEMSVFEEAGVYVRSITVEADSGVIVIVYKDSVAGGGALDLEPFVQSDGSVDWGCSGTFADNHLPAACRGGEDGQGEGI